MYLIAESVGMSTHCLVYIYTTERIGSRRDLTVESVFRQVPGKKPHRPFLYIVLPRSSVLFACLSRKLRSRGSGDASNEEAPPCDPKSNNLYSYNAKRVVKGDFHVLVDMETKDSLKRCAIMVMGKKIGLAHADLLYHIKLNIFFFCYVLTPIWF